MKERIRPSPGHLSCHTIVLITLFISECVYSISVGCKQRAKQRLLPWKLAGKTNLQILA